MAEQNPKSRRMLGSYWGIFVLMGILTLVGFLLNEIEKGNPIPWWYPLINYLYGFGLIFMLLLIIKGMRSYYRVAYPNIVIIARLLNAPVKQSPVGLWLYKVIKGNYKGREITCNFFLFSDALPDIFNFYIKTYIPPARKTSFFRFRKRLTHNIIVHRDKLWYLPKFGTGGWEKIYLYKEHPEQDFIEVFEELIKVAEDLRLGLL